MNEYDQVVEYQEEQRQQALADQQEADAKSEVQVDGLSAPDNAPVQIANGQEAQR